MTFWRDIPARWWAVLIGIAFGSMALVAMNGPTKGYARSIVAAILTAPLLSLVAGSLIDEDSSLEFAALIGGIVAVGGMGVVLTIARMAPSLVTAGLTGMAKTYLHISASDDGKPGEVERLRRDHTPDVANPELDELARRFDDEP